MNLTPEMRFSINQEISRRGIIFRRRISRLRQERAAATQLVMLAHGDSWFDYPLNGNLVSLDGSTDIIRQLDPTSVNDENVLSFRANELQCTIHNVSHWGYAADEMSRQGQQDIVDALNNYWKPLGQKPDAILFSGGGNDIVGDRIRHLPRLFSSGQRDWSQRGTLRGSARQGRGVVQESFRLPRQVYRSRRPDFRSLLRLRHPERNGRPVRYRSLATAIAGILWLQGPERRPRNRQERA